MERSERRTTCGAGSAAAVNEGAIRALPDKHSGHFSDAVLAGSEFDVECFLASRAEACPAARVRPNRRSSFFLVLLIEIKNFGFLAGIS